MKYLPGSEQVLVQQQLLLPQPEQLCGPFWVDIALRALTGESPGIGEIARKAGTLIYPHDLPGCRPPSASPRTDEWAGLPTTEDPSRSGTEARGVYRTLTGVHVLPVTGRFTGDSLRRLLDSLLDGDPVVVIAHVHTSYFRDLDGASRPWSWPTGHFVALIGVGEVDVAVADSYPIGSPPGQYSQSVDAVASALTRDGYGSGGLFVVSTSMPSPDVTGSLRVGVW